VSYPIDTVDRVKAAVRDRDWYPSAVKAKAARDVFDG